MSIHDPRRARTARNSTLNDIFETFKYKLCEVHMPDGACFVGVPAVLEKDDFILVKCLNGEVLVVEDGSRAEFRLVGDSRTCTDTPSCDTGSGDPESN